MSNGLMNSAPENIEKTRWTTNRAYMIYSTEKREDFVSSVLKIERQLVMFSTKEKTW